MVVRQMLRTDSVVNTMFLSATSNRIDVTIMFYQLQNAISLARVASLVGKVSSLAPCQTPTRYSATTRRHKNDVAKYASMEVYCMHQPEEAP